MFMNHTATGAIFLWFNPYFLILIFEARVNFRKFASILGRLSICNDLIIKERHARMSQSKYLSTQAPIFEVMPS